MSYIKQVEEIAHKAASRVHQETVDLVNALQERVTALEARLSGGDVVETATKAPRRGRAAKAEPEDAVPTPEPSGGESAAPGAKSEGK